MFFSFVIILIFSYRNRIDIVLQTSELFESVISKLSSTIRQTGSERSVLDNPKVSNLIKSNLTLLLDNKKKALQTSVQCHQDFVDKLIIPSLLSVSVNRANTYKFRILKLKTKKVYKYSNKLQTN